jgi:DnaJ-class molecular chaperone
VADLRKKYEDCPDCDGYGYTEGIAGDEKCQLCGGDGELLIEPRASEGARVRG